MADPALRGRLSTAALDVAQSMRLELVAAQWEQLIGELDPSAAVTVSV
jgi:hypothetical protein